MGLPRPSHSSDHETWLGSEPALTVMSRLTRPLACDGDGDGGGGDGGGGGGGGGDGDGDGGGGVEPAWGADRAGEHAEEVVAATESNWQRDGVGKQRGDASADNDAPLALIPRPHGRWFENWSALRRTALDCPGGRGRAC